MNPMRLTDLRAILTGHWVDTRVLDVSTIAVATQDELAQLLALLPDFASATHGTALPVARVHALRLHSVALTQRDLAHLCYLLPYLRTLVLTRVAWVRPADAAALARGTDVVGIARIMVRDAAVCAGGRTARFSPLDLVCLLSLFGKVGEVKLGPGGLDMAGVPSEEPAQTALQGLLDGALYKSCRVEKLTLISDSRETTGAWVSALQAQRKFLRFKSVNFQGERETGSSDTSLSANQLSCSQFPLNPRTRFHISPQAMHT